MDFLPTPLSSLPGIETPLLDITPYDFKGFPTFPRRCGFGIERLVDVDENPLRIAALLQSWLYFGMLSEFFGKAVNIDDFCYYDERPGCQPQIKLHRIERYLKQLHKMEPIERTELKRRRELVEQVVHYLRVLEDSPFHKQCTWPIVETTLSIRFLLYTVACFGEEATIDLDGHILIAHRLKQHGWCPSQIKRIEWMKNDTFGYYLSCVRRPNPRGFSHSQCPRTNCEASSTTLSNDYVIRHTHTDSRTCPLIHVDHQKIRNIIACGGVPLISIHNSPNASMELQVHAGTTNSKFIAISHVWSDGLGNPLSNALPECQVRRLAMYLANLPHPSFRYPRSEFRTLYGFGPVGLDLARFTATYRSPSHPTLFWMDTLCIPVSTKPNDTDTIMLKNIAINQMATLYKRAYQVLVLDSSIQEARISALHYSEILAHILFSNWMGRSWTLQEGALSPFVYFQFADGALNFLDLPRPKDRSSFFPLHPAKVRKMDALQNAKSLRWARVHKDDRHHLWPGRERAEWPNRMFEDEIYRTLHEECIWSLHNSAHGTAKNYCHQYESSGNFDGTSVTKSDAEWVQRFITIWNALAIRSTTMVGDLPAIMANLLGFNAHQILALPEAQRVGAMIYNCEMLPLSLLFNPGPRVRGTKHHGLRWVPTMLSRFIMQEMPAMRFDNGHNLVFRSNTKGIDAPTCLFIKVQHPADNIDVILTTNSGVQWHLTVYREANDDIQPSNYEYTAFLIKPIPESPTRRPPLEACCLRLNLARISSSGVSEFEGMYDCSCNAQRVADENISPKDGNFIMYDAEEIMEWQIMLHSDAESPFPRVARIT